MARYQPCSNYIKACQLFPYISSQLQYSMCIDNRQSKLYCVVCSPNTEQIRQLKNIGGKLPNCPPNCKEIQ